MAKKKKSVPTAARAAAPQKAAGGAAKAAGTTPFFYRVYDWLKAHPNWAAFGLFTLFIFVFFSEVIFGGKIYFTPDSKTPAALAAPLKQALSEDGVVALWMPYIFCGMPSYASLIFTPFAYFPYIVLMAFDLLGGLPAAFPHVLHYPFAGLGVYLFLRDRGAAFIPALFGGFAFMFVPHMVSMEVFGHGSKLMTAVYMPLALWSIDRLFRLGGLFYLGLTALLLGLQFQRGHVQIVYYTWMVLGAFLLYHLIMRLREKQASATPGLLGRFVVVLVLGLGLAAMLYLPIYEYTPYSIRGTGSALDPAAATDTGVGFDYATQWSFSLGETLTFILPSFYGFGGQTYWGTMPFTDYPHYMGILVFLLAIYAIAVRRGPLEIFFAIIIALALLISFGKNFPLVYRLFYDYMPFFNKFRVPVMILVVVQMGFAILAGLALQSLFAQLSQPVKKRAQQALNNGPLLAAGALIAIALLVTVAQSGFFNLMRGIYPDQYQPQQQAMLDQMRFDMLVRDWWIVSAILAAALLLYHFARRKSVSAKAFATAIIVLTLVDLWLVNGKINNPVDDAVMQQYLQADQLSTFLQQDQSTFRIFPVQDPFTGLNLFGEDKWAAHGIQSVGGYHAAKPRVIQDFFDATAIAPTYLQHFFAVGQREGRNVLMMRPDSLRDNRLLEHHNQLLDFLNAKYVITPYPLPLEHMVERAQVPYVANGQQVPLMVFENTRVLPRAYLVGEYRQIDEAKATLELLASPEFDPRRQVLLRTKPSVEPAPDSTATSELTGYGLHRISVKTQSVRPQLLVVSDTYYPPGWRASIDGEPAEILQANHAFRAIAVPAGTHDVVLEAHSGSFTTGMWLTLASSGLVGLLLVLGWRGQRRSSHEAAGAKTVETQNT